MLNYRSCPVCDGSNWQILGERVYRAGDKLKHSEYLQRRYEVLFGIWFADTQKITLQISLCEKCGFICYFPRPSEEEVTRKYEYLESRDANQALISSLPRITLKRSLTGFKYLKKHLDMSRVKKVLDYGGADGRLMHAFWCRGFHCFVVDYNDHTVADVTKLGNTVDCLNDNDVFNLIFCSHVFEHVASPLQSLLDLLRHIPVGGNIYIEVPFEVWKRPPILKEPVTHINFFTPKSLYNMMRIAELTVKDWGMAACLHPSGRKQMVVRAIGEKTGTAEHKTKPHLLPPDARELLHPSLFQRLAYNACMPLRGPSSLLSKLWKL